MEVHPTNKSSKSEDLQEVTPTAPPREVYNNQRTQILNETIQKAVPIFPPSYEETLQQPFSSSNNVSHERHEAEVRIAPLVERLEPAPSLQVLSYRNLTSRAEVNEEASATNYHSHVIHANEQNSTSTNFNPSPLSPFKPATANLVSGYVQYGETSSVNVSNIGSWFKKYIQLHENELIVCTSHKNYELQKEVYHINKNVFISIQDKRYFCCQLPNKMLVFQGCEQEALFWHLAFSFYATSGPFMQGFCQKVSNNQGYKPRFLRLRTDGVLSWYADEDFVNRRGSIQLRGVKSFLEQNKPQIVVARVGKKNYRFSFRNEVEANAWLKSFLWYEPHRQISNTKLRNNSRN